MTEFEKANAIRHQILAAAAEVSEYGQSWGHEPCITNINDAFGTDMVVDPSKLSSQEMDCLGFGRWSSDSKLQLIPLWLRQFLKHDPCYLSISGEIVWPDDNDHRFGMCAFGVIPNDQDADIFAEIEILRNKDNDTTT